ncbi:MAG: hypothetical protein SOZ00_02045 [Tidjanibacter sp.]|nr:hypothetical protein [Tidjanibacter sp.]
MDKEYYTQYERRLEEMLAERCGSEGRMMIVEEIDEVWQRLAPEYMAEAIGQINRYPAFTLAAAGYIGMALAAWWDTDWKAHSSVGYDHLRDEGGFDTMDEFITQKILGLALESDAAKTISAELREAAHSVMSVIEHEEIERGTSEAFYILARSARAMFHAGVSLELRRRGYKYFKVDVGGDKSIN